MIKPLQLAAYNRKVLLKSILYQILLLALVIALGYLLFGELVDDIATVLRQNNVNEFVSETINSIIDASFDSEKFASRLGELISDVRNSIGSLRLPFGGVTMSYVLFCVIFVAYRLLVSLADVAAGCQLEEFMTSNAERPFTWFVVKKQAQTWKFALLQTLFALPLDILLFVGCVGFYLLFLVAFNWWTVIPVLALAVLLYAARLSLFAFCLPNTVCNPDMRAGKAFREGMAKSVSRFWQVFWKTLVTVCIILAIVLPCLLYIKTPVVSAALTSVVSFVMFFYLKCINIVEYFRADNRPFFYKTVYIEGTDRYNRKQARLAKRGK